MFNCLFLQINVLRKCDNKAHDFVLQLVEYFSKLVVSECLVCCLLALTKSDSALQLAENFLEDLCRSYVTLSLVLGYEAAYCP